MTSFRIILAPWVLSSPIYLNISHDKREFVGLSSHSMLTSLKKTGMDSFDWFGGFAAQSLQWGAEPSAVATGKDCAGLSAIGLSPVSCDEISHFVCEKKPITTPAPP
jgi:hypothetical protein